MENNGGLGPLGQRPGGELDTIAYLTVNFACSSAHKRKLSWYATLTDAELGEYIPLVFPSFISPHLVVSLQSSIHLLIISLVMLSMPFCGANESSVHSVLRLS